MWPLWAWGFAEKMPWWYWPAVFVVALFLLWMAFHDWK